MTIILNKHMRNGRSYKKEASDNTKKLKDIMSKLIISEERSQTPNVEEAKPKTGGSVWLGQFKKQQESKKPKTFRL